MSHLTDTDTMAIKRHDGVQADSLADYICDYLDEAMEPALKDVFEAYVAHQPDLAQFVNDARSGMKALSFLRDPNIGANARE